MLEPRLLIEGTVLHDDNFAFCIFLKSPLVLIWLLFVESNIRKHVEHTRVYHDCYWPVISGDEIVSNQVIAILVRFLINLGKFG
jgi:hypothetical protein